MSDHIKPTKFQSLVQDKMKNGKSVLLVAPTGLGKTFAVTGDMQEAFCKIVYAVPLRALGGDIRRELSEMKRGSQPITAVIHHGDNQESVLFGEEAVVTTYDQVVCGVPGLPLSLPLKAGHAVAGALLMSRLILDEVHLAWGISDQALAILLAIIDFRNRLGLQTVILTATLPRKVSELIAERLGVDLVIVGEGDTLDDEGLLLREKNRQVTISPLDLKNKGKDGAKELDYGPLDEKLRSSSHKRIYFANTVERLQQTYDRLIAARMNPDEITILHNRMPRSWRTAAEDEVQARFGKGSPDGSWLLLTNQVAEAGLNISAPLVISDPAPVDTLVQRAGRCARWFRQDGTEGEFSVIHVPSAQLKDWAAPYRTACVDATMKSVPKTPYLTWDVERQWVDSAWGIKVDGQGKLPSQPSKKQEEQVQASFNQMTFALNLFDRAAQQHKPGEIASVFREILSAEVAVHDASQTADFQAMLDARERPETSSVSLGRAWVLLRDARGKAKVIRYTEDEVQVSTADYVQPGDILLVPSNVAYLHTKKGLCFGDATENNNAVLASEWKSLSKKERMSFGSDGHYQALLDHSKNVMRGTRDRLTSQGTYRQTLVKILHKLEPQKDANQLSNAVALIAALAAGFHDLGKADEKWQAKARAIDPACPAGLIGRTSLQVGHIGVPHTPPGYSASLKACELMGLPPSANYLVAAISLAAARHHSSLLNPATSNCNFHPAVEATNFIKAVLEEAGAPGPVRAQAQQILQAGIQKPANDNVPLLLPNDDLFPIYAIVGRAMLLADREDAAGQELEQWMKTQ